MSSINRQHSRSFFLGSENATVVCLSLDKLVIPMFCVTLCLRVKERKRSTER
jgi:hypothetical protein